jgi:hypothetical protein
MSLPDSINFAELSVSDIINMFCASLAERYSREGWKYLKSRKLIKKTIKDVVFEITVFSSKWNRQGESIEINGESRVWYKKWGGKIDVNAHIASCSYKAANTKSGYWDISRKATFESAVNEFSLLIEATIQPLVEMFEKDFSAAVRSLAETGFVNSASGEWYDVRIEFIDLCAGKEYAVIAARNFFEHVQYDKENLRRDIEKYRQGDRSKPWMINPGNLKYIVDNASVFDDMLRTITGQ